MDENCHLTKRHQFQLVLKITCETRLLKCNIFSSFQSLLAGGSFPLAMLLMAVTNVVSVFTVPPMLVWLTDLNSGVNLSRFGILMLVFCLVTLLPTIVSGTEVPFLELTHIASSSPWLLVCSVEQKEFIET